MKRLAYSIVEAAEAVGVSKSQMYRAVSDGTIPCVMLGSRKLVPADALETFIRQQSEKETERGDTDENQ